MRKRQYQGRGLQLVLGLEPRNQQTLVGTGTKGLVETLADLLLSALGMNGGAASASGGDGDEQ